MSTVSVTRFDGEADGSTTIIDETGRAWVANGTAEIDTGKFQYGDGSLHTGPGAFGGSGISSAAPVALGGNDFTIELWVWCEPLVVPDDNDVLEILAVIDNPAGYGVAITRFNGQDIYIWYSSDGVTWEQSGFIGSCPSEEWAHIAFVREGGLIYGFVNGVTTGDTYAVSGNAPAGTVGVGGRSDGTDTTETDSTFLDLFGGAFVYGFDGWIDEFAITSRAKYSGDFTPAPYVFESGSLDFSVVLSVPDVRVTLDFSVVLTVPEEFDFSVVLTLPDLFDFPVVLSVPSFTVYDFSVVLTVRAEIDGSVVIDAPLPPTLDAPVVIDAPLTVSLDFSVVLRVDINQNDILDFGVGINCRLLPASTTQQVSVIPSVIVDGKTVYIEAASVTFSDGQYAWTCSITLLSIKDYDRFQADSVFTIELEGDTYEFIVDSKSVDRDNFIGVAAVVNGISPLALYDEPRHAPAPNTWDTDRYALGIADELLGALSWEVLNWVIPKNTISGTNQSPVKIVQQVAKTTGAVLVSEPNGDVRVRYNYPVPVKRFDVETPSHTYTDIADNFAIREEAVTLDIVNSFRILNATLDSVGNTDDTFEFTQDPFNASKGTLRVHPYPWRNVVVAHTSDSRVSAALVGVREETLTEWVEFVGGIGRTARPVKSLGTVVWKYLNLGALTFEPETNELTSASTTEKEGLALVTYTTRYMLYNAAAPAGYKVQFVMRDLPGVTAITAAGIDIQVQRGAADRAGDDIIDTLIGSVAVAIQRGRNELDAVASGMQNVNATTVYRPGVRTGQLIEVEDSLTGTAWRGKVTAITHNVARVGQGHFELTTALGVQRPTL